MPVATRDTPIVRWVRVHDALIRLGESLPPAVTMADIAPHDTIIAVGSGLPFGTERVQARLTACGIVSAVIVDYAHEADFEAMVAELSATLGSPERSHPRRRGEEAADFAVWRDGGTELRLLRDPNRSAWTVRSTLLDVALARQAPRRRRLGHRGPGSGARP